MKNEAKRLGDVRKSRGRFEHTAVAFASFLSICAVAITGSYASAQTTSCEITGTLAVAHSDPLDHKAKVPHYYSLLVNRGADTVALQLKFAISPKKVLYGNRRITVIGATLKPRENSLLLSDSSSKALRNAKYSYDHSTCDLSGVTSVQRPAKRNSGAAADLLVPVCHSKPGAPASLYLNFLGDSVPSWFQWSNIVIPVFDQDGNATSFSDAEKATISKICAAVGDAYSPFNIDVTTVPPTSGLVSQIDVGGNGSWTGGTYGGIGSVGGINSSSASNPVRGFVFPANLGNGDPTYTSVAAEHESGHTMGLQHQSTWSGSTKTNEYNPGNSLTAPIMGNAYYAARALWWKGTDTNNNIQDDVAIISHDSFGYRPNLPKNSFSTAAPLQLDSFGNILPSSSNAGGVVRTLTDHSYFTVSTSGGNYTVNVLPGVDATTYHPTLHATLAIRDVVGNVVASANSSSTMGQSLSGILANGTYVVDVGSVAADPTIGDDIGDFYLTGSFPAPTCVENAPTVQVSPASQTVNVGSAGTYNVTFTNNSSSVCGSDTISVALGADVGTLTASSTPSPVSFTLNSGDSATATYTISDSVAETAHLTFSTQSALGAPTASANAALTTAVVDNTPPPVPSGVGVTESIISTKQGKKTTYTATNINVSWSAETDNVGGSGFKSYEVYRNGTLVATLSAGSTTFLDSNQRCSALTGGTRYSYSYTVDAVDNAGNRSSKSVAAGFRC